jgi:predicted MPP superfamily phosphohydrolase
MRRITFLLFATLLLASCTSLRYTGVGRIRDYNITSPQLPEAFDGYRIAFASDFHLESKFKERQLRGTMKALMNLAPDVLMLGGDYQEGCKYVGPLFDELVKATPPDGIYAVLGNNDYERCTQLIRETMRANGIQLLEDSTASIHRGADSIIVWGANAYAGRYATAPQRNSVDNKNRYQDTGDGNILLEIKNHKLETKNSSPFVILLTHTPDYIEEPEANIADLALAGHTHGGQVTLFGLYAPVTASKYGMRYRTGLKHNHQGTPIIISNGLGTSRRPIRMFAPTDIVIVTLRCE